MRRPRSDRVAVAADARTGTVKRFDADRWLAEAKIATLTTSNDQVPSLVEELTGEGIRGSWWSHPKAHLIYNTYRRIAECPYVLTVKLVEGKVTFVHMDIWASLLSAVLDEEWQQRARSKLTPLGRELLRLVEETGILLLTPTSVPTPGVEYRTLRNARQALERRCLVISGDTHTATGSHAPHLESWGHFRGFRAARVEPSAARVDALRSIHAYTANARLTIDG